MNELKQTKPGGVLLAVDGSPSAKSAAYAVAQIASGLQWGIHALYVVDIPQVFDMYGSARQELSQLEGVLPAKRRRVTLFKEHGTLALTEVRGICEAMHVPITTEMLAGNTTEIILSHASNYSLLGLGQRGNRHKDDREHLGSNFRQLAHRSPIPVLIGEKDDERRQFQCLLLAYDGGDLSRLALRWVERMQRLFTKVTVISVSEATIDRDAWLGERRKEIAASALADPEFIGASGIPGEHIPAAAASQGADLIAMGSYQHSRFLEWARDSTLSTVLREVHLPILAVQ